MGFFSLYFFAQDFSRVNEALIHVKQAEVLHFSRLYDGGSYFDIGQLIHPHQSHGCDLFANERIGLGPCNGSRILAVRRPCQAHEQK